MAVELKAIRQSADSAAVAVEQLGPTVDPLVTRMVQLHFQMEEAENGELSIEFLQGFHSGLFFALTWLVQHPGKSATGMITDLSVEAARKYVDKIEKLANKA